MGWDFPVKKSRSEPERVSQITEEIHGWIEENLIEKDRDNNVNRASSAPRCPRQRWYQANGYPSEPLKARAIITFGFGDLTEHWMKDLVKKACVGPRKLYSEVDFGKPRGTFTVQHREFTDYEQEDLVIILPNKQVISGHADGWGKRSSDGEWELIEIKSAADFGYKDFARGEEPDYIRQVHALMLSDKAKSLNVKSARFLYMNKNTSHISDRLYKFDQQIADQVISEFIAASGKEAPDRPSYGYERNKDGSLVYPCSYCAFVRSCFPSATMSFNSNGNPKWTVKE